MNTPYNSASDAYAAPAAGGPSPLFSVAPTPPVAAPVATPPTPPAPEPAAPASVIQDPVIQAPVTPPPIPAALQAPVAPAAPMADPAAGGQVVPATIAAAGVTLARVNDGLPMVLDPFAVACRAVLVLIGSTEPAKHIARTAIDLSIEHDSSAALDVVVPRAIDLVLRRAAHLVSIGAGPKVVDHYTERLELWRRLAKRSGLEPAAIVLTLAPFPIPTVASILRVSLAEVEACIDDWYAGIDPEDTSPLALGGSGQVIDLRAPVDLRQSVNDVAHGGAGGAAGSAHHENASPRSARRPGWGRLRLRSA